MAAANAPPAVAAALQNMPQNQPFQMETGFANNNNRVPATGIVRYSSSAPAHADADVIALRNDILVVLHHLAVQAGRDPATLEFDVHIYVLVMSMNTHLQNWGGDALDLYTDLGDYKYLFLREITGGPRNSEWPAFLLGQRTGGPVRAPWVGDIVVLSPVPAASVVCTSLNWLRDVIEEEYENQQNIAVMQGVLNLLYGALHGNQAQLMQLLGGLGNLQAAAPADDNNDFLDDL